MKNETMPSLRPAAIPDDVPSSNNNNNDNKASSNKVRAVILTSEMKSQLRSIIPMKNQGRNRGVSEGDILCKVKGFIAACRGLSTVQVLMLNFPDEIEIIRVGGTDRFCLHEISPKNYFADKSLEKSSNSEMEMESCPVYNIDRKGESCANKPLISCMKHKATNNKYKDGVVKKEPGKEEHRYTNYATVDHSLSSSSNNSSERRVNKYVVRKDSGKIPAFSDDMIANILSILPSKDVKVRGTSMSTIIENVPGFLDACNGKDFQQILEANLLGKIIIGSDSEGTKRYYTRRDGLNANNIGCSPSTSLTSCNSTNNQSRGRGISNQPKGMSGQQLPNIVSITQDTASASASVKSSGVANSSAKMKGEKGNSAEANIVKLLQEETKIKLSLFKEKYHTRFKRDLSHSGKLKHYLQQNPDVVLIEPVKCKGKGKGNNELYVSLNRKIRNDLNIYHEKKTDATTNTATRQVAQETKASDTNLAAASISTNDCNGNTDQKQVVPITKVNTPHKIQDALQLTDDQAQTCTKFPPGCRVVWSYQGLPISNDGHTFAQIRIGKVISVSISLSSTSKGQLKHEIKLNKRSIMVEEGNLAYVPQCLVYYQLEEEQEPAVVLSCQKDDSDDTWQYSILVSRLDGDGETVSLMLQNISLEQLTYREASSVVHDSTKQYTDPNVGGGGDSQSRNSKKRPNNAGCDIDNKRTKTG